MELDYLDARCLKVSLKGDTLLAHNYDHNSGEGAAVTALKAAGLPVIVIPNHDQIPYHE